MAGANVMHLEGGTTRFRVGGVTTIWHKCLTTSPCEGGRRLAKPLSAWQWSRREVVLERDIRDVPTPPRSRWRTKQYRTQRDAPS